MRPPLSFTSHATSALKWPSESLKGFKRRRRRRACEAYLLLVLGCLWAPGFVPGRAVGRPAVGGAEAVPEVSDRDLSVLLASQFPVFVAVGALIPVLPLPLVR